MTEFQHQIGTFQGYAGCTLVYQSCRPVGMTPKSLFIIVHGGSDYADGMGYRWLAEYMATAGHAAYSYDQRGHGRSQGQRMHADDWRELVADLNAFIRFARIQEPDLPIFLFGISLGSIVVLEQAIEFPSIIDGVIAASAPVGEIEMPGAMVAMARFFSRIAPRWKIKMPPDPSTESRDQKLAAIHVADPLKGSVATIGFFGQLLKVFEQLPAQADQVKLPILILQGGDDPVAKPDDTFFKKVASNDKTYKLYDGARHNLLIEINREEIYDDIESWVSARLGEKN